MYRLDKAIDNEKLDVQLAMEQFKKMKEKISQSLKRRKYLLAQMNDNLYIEEIIKDICQDISSDEADATIKDLLEKNLTIKDLLENNLTLHEEVKKMKREQEIQSVRMCEDMEQKDKAKEEKIFLIEKI